MVRASLANDFTATIAAMKEDSVLMAAGIRVGDIIRDISPAGEEATHRDRRILADLRSMARQPCCGSFTITFERDGQIQTRTIVLGTPLGDPPAARDEVPSGRRP